MSSRMILSFSFKHRYFSPSLAQTPGPDLAWQDAVMQSEAFIVSENSCIPTSRRARAGWPAMPELYTFCFRNITVTTACYNQVAPPDPVSVSGRGGQAGFVRISDFPVPERWVKRMNLRNISSCHCNVQNLWDGVQGVLTNE